MHGRVLARPSRASRDSERLLELIRLREGSPVADPPLVFHLTLLMGSGVVSLGAASLVRLLF
jgi:hypothetical protein